MFRIALPALTLLTAAGLSPALAHDGLHHHPHGIEFGWIVAALAGTVVGGLAVAVLRGRK